MSRYNIFPLGTLAVLGALDCKTVIETAQSLLEKEEEIAKEKAREPQRVFENIAKDIEKAREELNQ